MKFVWKSCLWMAGVAILLSAFSATATVNFPAKVKNIQLEPLGEIELDQPIRMRLTFDAMESVGDSVTIQLVEKRGVTAADLSRMLLTATSSGHFETEFDITVHDGDTSELRVEFFVPELFVSKGCWFIAEGDSVTFYHQHPESLARRHKPQSERESEKVWPEQKWSPDSNYFRTSVERYPQEEHDLRRMKWHERTPLSGKPVQYFKIGKDRYRRYEGESKFTLVPKRSIVELIAEKRNYLDSIAVLPDEAELRVCLNLRGHHLEFVEKMLAPLGAPESESFYHLTVTKALLEQLREKGVPIMYLDLEDIVHRPHPSDLPPSSVPSDPQGDNSVKQSRDAPREELWREDFTSGWLSRWQETGGPLPPCFAQANVDGSGDGPPDGPEDIDISDLVYLVDYMFTGGPVPPEC